MLMHFVQKFVKEKYFYHQIMVTIHLKAHTFMNISHILFARYARDVIHSFDITLTSVHNIYYLKDVRE